MGSARFTVGALAAVAKLKSYAGRLSYAPPTASARAHALLPSTAGAAAGGGAGVAAPDPSLLPPLSSPVPADWVVIEGEFLVFWAMNTSHAAHDMLAAPAARLSDGLLQLLLVRSGMSRWRLARLLLAIESGTHVGSEGLLVVTTPAFRLEPLSPDGILALDGERIEYGPVQAEVRPAAARVFAPCARLQ